MLDSASDDAQMEFFGFYNRPEITSAGNTPMHEDIQNVISDEGDSDQSYEPDDDETPDGATPYNSSESDDSSECEIHDPEMEYTFGTHF